MNSRTMRARTGKTLPAVALAGLALLLLGAIGAWVFLGGGEKPSLTSPGSVEDANPTTPTTESTSEPTVAVAPEAHVEVDGKVKRALNEAATMRVKDRKTGKVEFKPIHDLKGRVLDDRDDSPVYFFRAYLVAGDDPDPLKAMNSQSPHSMRNGDLHLTNQLEGTYHLIVESREHEPVVRKIQLPYEGELVIRLKRGTCIRGVVRDSFQQPVANVQVQLAFDPERLDPGSIPPVQRLATTDANGVYQFLKLPGGTYSVSATLFGDKLAEEPEFRLDPGQEVQRNFMIGQFGAIRIVITNPIDQPLARAKATLSTKLDDGRDRVARSAIADLKGNARLEFVREGSYKLKVSMAGFVPHEETVVVAAGDASREINVRLEVAPKSGG